MFRLGVVSDSHGRLEAVERVAPLFSGVDALAHLGDGLQDARRIAARTGLPLYQVAGNCDPQADCPSERREVFAGVPTLLTHGNLYHVKHSLLRLQLRAEEVGARLALYGHTHEAAVDWARGILLVNPGALRFGRYAIIEFRETGPCPFLLGFE